MPSDPPPTPKILKVRSATPAELTARAISAKHLGVTAALGQSAKARMVRDGFGGTSALKLSAVIDPVIKDLLATLNESSGIRAAAERNRAITNKMITDAMQPIVARQSIMITAALNPAIQDIVRPLLELNRFSGMTVSKKTAMTVSDKTGLSVAASFGLKPVPAAIGKVTTRVEASPTTEPAEVDHETSELAQELISRGTEAALILAIFDKILSVLSGEAEVRGIAFPVLMYVALLFAIELALDVKGRGWKNDPPE